MTSLLGYLILINEYQPCLDISSSQGSDTVGHAKEANYFCIDEPFIGIDDWLQVPLLLLHES
jgi:hypothetical protein